MIVDDFFCFVSTCRKYLLNVEVIFRLNASFDNVVFQAKKYLFLIHRIFLLVEAYKIDLRLGHKNEFIFPLHRSFFFFFFFPSSFFFLFFFYRSWFFSPCVFEYFNFVFSSISSQNFSSKNETNNKAKK
jgi:hypothetical protein